MQLIPEWMETLFLINFMAGIFISSMFFKFQKPVSTLQRMGIGLIAIVIYSFAGALVALWLMFKSNR